MSNKNVIIAIVVILILGVGAFKVFHLKSLLMGSGSSTSTISTPSVTPVSSTSTSPSVSPSASSQNLIKVTSTGFMPDTITIKAGDSVTWMNADSAPHQVNSNPHPTHTAYPPLNTVGLLQPGESKSLTFPTPGTYGFHDHLNPQFKGSVIVE